MISGCVLTKVDIIETCDVVDDVLIQNDIVERVESLKGIKFVNYRCIFGRVFEFF